MARNGYFGTVGPITASDVMVGDGKGEFSRGRIRLNIAPGYLEMKPEEARGLARLLHAAADKADEPEPIDWDVMKGLGLGLPSCEDEKPGKPNPNDMGAQPWRK